MIFFFSLIAILSHGLVLFVFVLLLDCSYLVQFLKIKKLKKVRKPDSFLQRMSSSPAVFLSIWEVGCCPISHCLSHSQFRSQCCLKDWFLETAIQMRQGVSRDHFGKQSLKSAKCFSWKWFCLLQFLRIGPESSQAQGEDFRDPVWLLDRQLLSWREAHQTCAWTPLREIGKPAGWRLLICDK